MATRIVQATGDGLAEAVADTEDEIFTEAVGTEPLDRDGDHSLEEMGDGLEGDVIDDSEPDEIEPETEGEDKQDDDGKEQPRDEKTGEFKPKAGDDTSKIPPGRLREESEKRRTAETELNATKQALADMQRRFDALEAAARLNKPPGQQQPTPAQNQAPDMFADPEGWQAYMIAQADLRATARLVESSLADAADTHGDKFQAAYTELQRIGTTEKQQFGSSPTVNRIWSAPNPGKALMAWHSQQATIREVGSDPQAWLAKQLEEKLNDPKFLATALERAKANAEQGDQGRPRTTTRMPKSLNSQTGGTHQDRDPELYDGSEKSVFDFAAR